MTKKAFTLVELIVVITILAVLGTVAFVSFQDYVGNSRDSKRTTDIKNIEKALELSKLQTGVYPNPGTSTNITYSGATAWKQGEFNNEVVRVVRNFKEAPKDPLVDTFYGYSVTKNRGEYQLGGVLEDIDYGTSANGKLAGAYVKGNYNGKTVKVSTGSTTYVLAAPSILTSDLNETDLLNIINAQKLVYKNHKNLPASYTGTTYDVNGGFDFTPKSGTIVAYEGDLATVDSTTLVDNLQKIYTGTVISEDPDIEVIFSEDKDLTTDVILNKKPGTTASSGGGGGSSNSGPVTCMDMPQSDVDALNFIYAASNGYESGGPVNYSKEEWCNLTEFISMDGGNIPDEIQHLTNLTKIDFDNVTGVSKNLWKLTNLETLILKGYNGAIINPPSEIANLTKLKELRYNLKVTDYSEISKLTNLTKLEIKPKDKADLADISWISGLVNLNTLSMRYTDIVDISPLSSLVNLTSLSLDSSNITNISALSGMTKMKSISLDSSNITNISALSGMTKIESISLRNNNILDASSLGSMPLLKRIDLPNNNISVFPDLRNASELGYIDVRGNNINDISSISLNTKLKDMYLQNNNFTDISSLDSLGSHPGGLKRSFNLDCSEIITPATEDGDFYKSIDNYVECYTDGSTRSTSVRPYSSPIFQ